MGKWRKEGIRRGQVTSSELRCKLTRYSRSLMYFVANDFHTSAFGNFVRRIALTMESIQIVNRI